ncbi:DUF2497 domain-containing protein [Hyphomicrobium sp.]|jgi:hypothetical protein|uniref:DUF2497 domain-containing protein n=1 Tax=Hyphomicrobium sp. TaxID=82 RepID=UPI002CD6CBB4|nr:DUF2497 domain-containing protein [Hyphomicrobium sp.]HVZ04251.1 DUF2497 domain-containing protein [Hyphomicrobium sp.]
MTMMNGAKHDVEDILASIRTSIADRAPEYDMDRREARVATLRGRGNIADEALEFELPAIFKAASQAAPERPNLLGRLSEALGSNAQHAQQSDWGRGSRTVIPFEPAHGRMIEPPPRALKAARQEQPEDVAEPEAHDVKRVMPTFFDTRMSRMSQMAAKPTPVEPPRQAPPQPSLRAEPPRLPEGPVTDAAHGANGGGVEDAAAQLLRPILRQWLTENMPKIVEKALMDETGKR